MFEMVVVNTVYMFNSNTNGDTLSTPFVSSCFPLPPQSPSSAAQAPPQPFPRHKQRYFVKVIHMTTTIVLKKTASSSAREGVQQAPTLSFDLTLFLLLLCTLLFTSLFLSLWCGTPLVVDVLNALCES